MINKIVQSVADALAGVKDGSTVLIGGFGSVGQPDVLIEGLIEQGATNLTAVLNNAGVGRIGVARLMELGRVRKIICSFPRSSDPVVFETLYREGRIELEIVPQGTLAERIRAAGAGIPAFFTATAAGTLLARGKESREFDGKQYVMERALKGDVALVEAWEADRWGNLVYRGSGANFNPVMAMGADLTIAQVQHIRELGELHPHMIMTPGVYVNRVVQVDRGGDLDHPRASLNAEGSRTMPFTRDQMAARLAARRAGGMVRQPRHRHPDDGGEPCSADARGDLPVGERRHRHGPGTGQGP